MERELQTGDVFACRDPECRIEIEVKQGGHCRELSCCGQEMACVATADDNLDRYEREVRSDIDRDDA